MTASALLVAAALAAPQTEALVVQGGEPPRLTVAVQGGYGAQVGARFSGLATDAVTTGSLFGLDLRYRVAGPFSLGVFGRYSRYVTQPSAGSVSTVFFLSDSVLRGGLSFALSHRFRFVEVSGELGLGYQTETRRAGPTGHVTLCALWVAARHFSLGVFVEGVVVRDLGEGGLACTSASGQCTAVEPSPYGWLSGGLRGAFNLL